MKKKSPAPKKIMLRKIVMAFCIKPEQLEKIERIAIDYPFDGKRSRVLQRMIDVYEESNAN